MIQKHWNQTDSMFHIYMLLWPFFSQIIFFASWTKSFSIFKLFLDPHLELNLISSELWHRNWELFCFFFGIFNRRWLGYEIFCFQSESQHSGCSIFLICAFFWLVLTLNYYKIELLAMLRSYSFSPIRIIKRSKRVIFCEQDFLLLKSFEKVFYWIC